MKVPFVDLGLQNSLVRDEVLGRFEEIVDRGAFILGESVADFERAFADYHGTTDAVAVASGTDALVLALKAVGVGIGDEVITAANTFIATVEAIAHVGAK